MLTKLKSTGETVVAGKDGYPKTYANRTQAQNCAAGIPGAEVISRGRPFYVRVPDPSPFPLCDCGHESPQHRQSGCGSCLDCECPSFRDCGDTL